MSPTLESPTSDRKQSLSSTYVRDHLANERTYLAWMRTAIALMGFGVLIARLRYLLSPQTLSTGQGLILGLIFAVMGLVTILLSTYHYFSGLQAIDQQTYQPARHSIFLLSLMLMFLGAGVLYVILHLPTP